MPSSPHTPTHSRKTSAISVNVSSPHSGHHSPRRLSKSSINTPTTPSRLSLNRSDSAGLDLFNNGGEVISNGIGNLADELAGAWAEDDEEDEDEDEPDMNFQEGPKEVDTTRDSGVDVSEALASAVPGNDILTSSSVERHHRRNVSDYDGSEYGENSDMDSAGMPPGLIARMDLVESLVRKANDNNGTDLDPVVKRVVDGLKDLGGQSGVEGGASRLITAHTALSTHLLHQTRLLHSLTYPLFSPMSIPPDPEFIDEIMPLLVTIGESMPRPTTAAFNSLTHLHSLTADLVQTLNYLTDTLHMSRQTTTTATRRLKSARELVAEMRKEDEVREEGERWIRRGNWSERLGARECAGVCGDVVGGFEEVCNGWRARLIAQAEAVGA